MDWQALVLSLKIASSCTAILLLVGLPLTFFMSQRRHGLISVVEAIFSLPLVMPPTVLGFYLLLVLGPLKLAFTFEGLLIASLLSSLPFAFQSFLAAFRSVNPMYYEMSWSLGETPWWTFIRVAVPLAKEGLLAGAILSFAHSLGEFGVVLMIGGNIPGVSRTLAISLYDQVESFNREAANQTAFILLGFSLVALVAVSWLRRKPGLA